MPTRRHSHPVTFPTHWGLTLSGTFDEPAPETSRGLAVFAHHFAGSSKSPAASRICKTLANAGVACLRFDFPGCGSSEGNFSDGTLDQYTNSVLAAAQWLRNHTEGENDKEMEKTDGSRKLPLALIGHSLGGDTVLRAANKCEDVQAVVTIGTPFTPGKTILGSVAAKQGTTSGNSSSIGDDPSRTQKLEQQENQGSHLNLRMGGFDISINEPFIASLQNADMAPFIRKLPCPLLVVHSDADTIVPINDAELIFQEADFPKSFIDVHNSDHLLTQRGTAQQVGRVIAEWLELLTKQGS